MIYEVFFQNSPTMSPWLVLATTDFAQARLCLEEAKAHILYLRGLDSSGNVVFLRCQKRPWNFTDKDCRPNEATPVAASADTSDHQVCNSS
jgi:hypothetical protein